ncbi:hypothetical protein [Arthrobacter burdickii]|uniref:Uncharacterized protein n=1 Tax=Arthrobacter burdickii TaxID=3035920 RepID=A0ABT8K561_9MICC|nr:hypothetical protein [Arthrobacter burdickii]MDN4611459.1 hypothetical protein [Arthrobacter burdickii]
MNPDTWGTVADWVGGIGTTAAFVAAVVVMAKDAKVRKIAQARKVVYVAETTQLMAISVPGGPSYGGGTSTRYILKNLSDEPIYRVFFYAHAGSKAGTALDSTAVILPGDEFSYDFDIDEPPLACFRDNSNIGWIRNIKGKVHPYRGRAFELDAKAYAE